MSASATLWPIGTSILDCSRNDELSAVTTHSMSVPALRSSTTTTPTVSFLSWTSRCGAAMDLPRADCSCCPDKALPKRDQAAPAERAAHVLLRGRARPTLHAHRHQHVQGAAVVAVLDQGGRARVG